MVRIDGLRTRGQRDITHRFYHMDGFPVVKDPLSRPDSIAATFRKRVASGLQTARSFVIPNQDEQASETTDFELVTWLVIKAEA